MNSIDNTLRDIILKVQKIDAILNEKFSSTADLYVSPFVQEMVLESNQVYVDFKSKFPRMFLNLYDIYVTSILGLSVIRGIRTKFECYNLARQFFRIKKLQTQKSHARIYQEIPGTFVTFGKVEEIDFSGSTLLLNLLRYYNDMAAKPFIYFEAKHEQGKPWHWNYYIIPTPLSFLSIKTPEGNYGITPANLIMMIDLSKRKWQQKIIFGENLEGISTVGYVLAVNPIDYRVRYFGPFPIFVPDIEIAETKILELDGVIFGYFRGLITFHSMKKPFISNNLSKRTGEIILFSSWPFSLDIYVLSTQGEIQEDKHNTPFGRFLIPKVVTRTKKVKILADNINNARIRFYRNIVTKRELDLIDLINQEKVLEFLLNKTRFIKKTQEYIYTYEPTFYLYAILSGTNPEDIEQEIINISSKKEILGSRYLSILRSVSKYRKLYITKKLISNEVIELKRRHKLWQVI